MGAKKSKEIPPGLPPPPPGYEWTQKVGKNDVIVPAQGSFSPYDMMNPYMQSQFPTSNMIGGMQSPTIYGSNPLMAPTGYVPNQGFTGAYYGLGGIQGFGAGVLPSTPYSSMPLMQNTYMPQLQPTVPYRRSSLPILSPQI